MTSIKIIVKVGQTERGVSHPLITQGGYIDRVELCRLFGELLDEVEQSDAVPKLPPATESIFEDG